MWTHPPPTHPTPTAHQVPMTGLQAKRKRDEDEPELPALKCGRGASWACAAVARRPSAPPPAPLWPLDSPPGSDDEDDDEDDDDEAGSGAWCCPLEAAPPFGARGYWAPATVPPSAPPSNGYQTIRCAENGKSYLELGVAPTPKVPPGAAYRQQRLAVLNLSMCKLSRFRQFAEPSLHRSVLICNTLRRIEREMEQEHDEPAVGVAPHSHHGHPHHMQQPHQQQQPPPQPPSYPATPPPALDFFELREAASPAPRPTPFPSPQHPGGDAINWGSVLSLSSQTDLDPLNNNAGAELVGVAADGSVAALGDDSALKSLERSAAAAHAGVNGDELVDSLMQVLVGT